MKKLLQTLDTIVDLNKLNLRLFLIRAWVVGDGNASSERVLRPAYVVFDSCVALWHKQQDVSSFFPSNALKRLRTKQVHFCWKERP